MSVVAVPEPEQTEPHGEPSRLMVWANDARQAALVAESLSKTSFVPDSMRGKGAEITAAILTGQEIGLEPMSALRSIDVIQGTPAMRAHALRGLVQSRGHEVWVESSTDQKAVVCGQRNGSDKVQKSTWTMERASRQNLTGKDNWKRMPEAMLVARATSEVCRLIASDVLLGMPYSIEEMEDVPDEAPAPRRTAKRKQVEAAPVEEPALEAGPDPLANVVVPITEQPEPDLEP